MLIVREDLTRREERIMIESFPLPSLGAAVSIKRASSAAQTSKGA